MFCVREFGGGYLDFLCPFFLFYISELRFFKGIGLS